MATKQREEGLQVNLIHMSSIKWVVKLPFNVHMLYRTSKQKGAEGPGMIIKPRTLVKYEEDFLNSIQHGVWEISKVFNGTDIAKLTRKRLKPDKHGHGKGKENTRAGRMLSKIKEPMIEKNEGEGLIGASNRLRGLEASPRQYKYKQGLTHKKNI
ncbi:hypothetical protein Tco_1418204 [Tanacetum coccineum]